MSRGDGVGFVPLSLDEELDDDELALVLSFDELIGALGEDGRGFLSTGISLYWSGSSLIGVKVNLKPDASDNWSLLHSSVAAFMKSCMAGDVRL